MARERSQPDVARSRRGAGPGSAVVYLQPARRGDGLQAGLLAAAVFAALASYYLVKPAREALLATTTLDISRTELRALASVAQGICALAIAVFYARLADRLPRRVLVATVNGVFAGGLAGAALLRSHVQSVHLDLVVYVGAGALAVIVVAQFWAFATDLAGRRAGRLLPLLSLSASAGGASGAWMAGHMIQVTANSGTMLFLAAAAGLCLATVLATAADRRHSDAAAAPASRIDTVPARSGFTTVLEHRYLLGAAVVALLAQWVSTNGDHLLFGFVQQSLDVQAADLGIAAGILRQTHVAHGTMAFYADFFLWSNLAALAVQIAVVIGGPRGRSGCGLLLVLPAVTLVSSAAMLFVPALASLKLLKVTENAARYSVNNTASQLLWLPTTAAMKYKAKIVIDAVVVRFADTLAALSAFVGLTWLRASLEALVFINLVLVVAWLAAAAALTAEQQRRVGAARSQVGHVAKDSAMNPALPMAA